MATNIVRSAAIAKPRQVVSAIRSLESAIIEYMNLAKKSENTIATLSITYGDDTTSYPAFAHDIYCGALENIRWCNNRIQQSQDAITSLNEF